MARNAAQAWHAMHRAGFEMTVSVNLSVASLTDVTFAERIMQVVREEELDPAHMVLEVTESLATSHLAATLENLSRLRIKGFGLSLDDYGTGYSSMQRLSRVPFTEIKIDGSFVKGAPGDASAHAMVESSLELGRKLRLDVVAEGVETHIEWELLLALGCPVAQGYYIGRPMTSSELLEWARARRKLSVDASNRANR
jgi:EAL domain-containing protein (putative c-di-GMP-specific phosphodiesterase class I)